MMKYRIGNRHVGKARANANWPSAGNWLLTLSSKGRSTTDRWFQSATSDKRWRAIPTSKILVTVKVVENQQVYRPGTTFRKDPEIPSIFAL